MTESLDDTLQMYEQMLKNLKTISKSDNLYIGPLLNDPPNDHIYKNYVKQTPDAFTATLDMISRYEKPTLNNILGLVFYYTCNMYSICMRVFPCHNGYVLLHKLDPQKTTELCRLDDNSVQDSMEYMVEEGTLPVFKKWSNKERQNTELYEITNDLKNRIKNTKLELYEHYKKAVKYVDLPAPIVNHIVLDYLIYK